MLSATRRWFRRNRTPIAIGFGVVGAGYLATQYVLAKINDARERMSSERIAKENLRRRFEQNQEDCAYTVMALLPTATTSLLESMPTERITLEIQQMKGAARAAGPRSAGESSTSPPSIADTTMTSEEEAKSIASMQSESGVHASQVALPPTSAPAAAPATAGADGAQDGGQSSAQKSRKTKRQLWDDLTISSITRAFTLVYTLALLTMLTRIQLNLLGRRSYLSSVVSLATGTAQSTISLENNDDDNDDDDYNNNPDQAYGSDFETNRKYLTFSWWLLNRGWTDVRDKVEAAVREVFGHLSPRDLLSFDTFAQLTLEVRRKVEARPADGSSSSARRGGGGGGSQWLCFLLPPTTLETFVLQESGVLGDSAAAATTRHHSSLSTSPSPPSLAQTPVATSPALRRLLDETSDLIESPAFAHVLSLLLDAGFSVLLHDKVLSGAFLDSRGPPSAELQLQLQVQQQQQDTTTTTTTTKSVVLLPKILSVLTRQAHAIGNGMPNEYHDRMEAVPDLEAFAAVVYSSNWENEIRDADADADVVPPPQAQAQAQPQASQASRGEGEEGGDESASASLVFVDPTPTQSSLDSAWEKATQSQSQS